MRPYEWSNHVELGLWPHVMLILLPSPPIPCPKWPTEPAITLLATIYLQMSGPVCSRHGSGYVDTSGNCSQPGDIAREHQLIDPGTGELASGLQGKGRMAEPEVILEKIIERFGRETQTAEAGRSRSQPGPTAKRSILFVL